MQNFDLLDFLSHNYISLGDLVNQNMWRSYCYGNPNIWWWHLKEETEMPFGVTDRYFTKNNRYRVSFWMVDYDNNQSRKTFYLYIEDLKLSKVKVYVSTSYSLVNFRTIHLLEDIINFKNLSIEISGMDNNVLHTYSWNDGVTLLKGKQIFQSLICESLLIFDKNEALLYLHSFDEGTIIHFLSFSEQPNIISGIEYTTSEVTNMGESIRLYNGLNNTHTYISNWIDHITSLSIIKDSTSIQPLFTEGSDLDIVRPLSDHFPWFILFVFRPTPVSGNAPINYNILLPIEQNYTGYHVPITRWKLNNGYSLSINCSGVNTHIFIQGTSILTYNKKYFCDSLTCSSLSSLFVNPDIYLNSAINWYHWEINVLNGNTRYKLPSNTTYYSCNIPIWSLFYYYGDNTENLVWLFHYDSDPNLRTAYVVYAQNMRQYADIIGDAYGIHNLYLAGIYDQMHEIEKGKDTYITLNSYLWLYDYHIALTEFFIFNTLAHTAPQVVNGSWNYMHYMRFVLDDYTSSNLRIPLAIVEGDIKRDNIIKYREIRIDKMATSQRYPIVQQGSLSKAHMPDVVLDGYIASLNADAGKNEDSTFGTLIPYYDLKEAKIQEPHPEWYFRIHIHAGTWYYIFNNIMSVNNNQMRTYRIQHNDGSLRIVLDVGVYFEIITARDNNKKYTIVYADIFPSVYWCHGNNSYEFLNVNVEWIQCRYSMPGSNMIRVRPNNNTVIIEQPVAI